MRWSVLVAISDNDLLQQVSAALARQDMAVTTVGTLTEAGTALAAVTPSILVLDTDMPDGDGMAFCVGLRADGWNLPIILLGASAHEDDIVRGFEAGADDYLVKPVGLRELAARVGGQLRHAERSPVRLLYRAA